MKRAGFWGLARISERGGTCRFLQECSGIIVFREELSFAPYAVSERFGTQSLPFNRDEDNVRADNVHQRIRLYYGQDYGLEMQSIKGLGTTMILHIPKINERNGGF